MGKSKSKPVDPATAAASEVCTPPTWFRVARWACFAATVGIAVGMLALLTAQLSGIQTTFPDKSSKYFGRPIQIQYCMFSSNTDANQESRCNLGYGVASVSLVLSFIWSYMQTLRRNPFKHPKAKLADLVVSGIWMLLWLATAIVLCVWADQANKAGDTFLKPATDARNGLCVMAWLEFLLVSLLTASAGLLFTKKCQSVFNKWDEKAKERKFAHEQKRLEHSQAKVVDAEGRAIAAKQASETPGIKGPAIANTGVHTPAAVGAPGVGGAGAGTALPVSSKGAAAEDNPFRG